MVKVTAKDRNGNVVAEFEGLKDESLGITAQEAGVDVPFSCGVGACRTCLCRVEQGYEHIDPEAIGPMQIDVDPEEREILSCIAGLKQDAPDDAEIVLEIENL